MCLFVGKSITLEVATEDIKCFKLVTSELKGPLSGFQYEVGETYVLDPKDDVIIPIWTEEFLEKKYQNPFIYPDYEKDYLGIGLTVGRFHTYSLEMSLQELARTRSRWYSPKPGAIEIIRTPVILLCEIPAGTVYTKGVGKSQGELGSRSLRVLGTVSWPFIS